MNIVIGVCGGIAAYKVCELVRKFKKIGHNVQVMMTQNSTKFVSPLVLQTLSNNPVLIEMFTEPANWDIEHISLSQKADVILIAPATANVIGKVANGIADDFLTTTVMSATCPILFVPAMNVNMYANPILQDNVNRLRQVGYFVMEPETGELACKDVGKGRLPQLEKIVEQTLMMSEIRADFAGKKILITAGPTREWLDPVRYVSNASSGKMGFSIASSAQRRGAHVTVVSGPVSISTNPAIERVHVITAKEMHDAVMARFAQFDILIMVAAVCDYRSESVLPEKMKKTDDKLHLVFTKNPDIAKDLGKMKGNRILVGFAAETTDLLSHMKQKLTTKNLDMIVGNDVTQEGAGFETDTNIVTILDKLGNVKQLEAMPKEKLANIILDEILGLG